MSHATVSVQTPVNTTLREHLNRRLALAMGLPKLDEQRRALARDGQLAPPVSAELTRQVRQLKHPPIGPQVQQLRQHLEQQLAQVRAHSPADSAEHHILIQALEVGLRQTLIFDQREQLIAPLLEAAGSVVTDEPLWRVFRDHGIDAADLFGWTVYARTLDDFEQALRQRSESSDDHQGLSSLRIALALERCACLTPMTEAFWAAYENAAALLVSGKLDAEQKRYVRCFLRYGLVIHAPWLLDESVSRHCLNDCDQPIVHWQNDITDLTAVYADEYIDLAACGDITPTPDEQLELNGRNTEPWKLDRQRRRWIHGRHLLAALTQTREHLLARIEQLTEKNEKLEKELRSLDRRDPAYHQNRAHIQQNTQNNKVTMARLRRALTILQQNKQPHIEQVVREASAKLEELPLKAEPQRIARHEARSIRRLCRLCAHLHEPFLPAEVAGANWFSHGFENDRTTVCEHIVEIERRDPTLFQWILAHSKKMENRVHVRQPPYVLIVPGSGQMALSINPRTGTEVGRWVVPMWNQRRGMLEAMLHQMAADFRFDTSRSSGGVDWLHSDTLAAAYATVRWNYRNRSRDRRDKAGIDIHQSDRVNFRRHYRIFLESADDGGRKLFYKCPEAYEAFCQFMMLPPGVERCRQT